MRSFLVFVSCLLLTGASGLFGCANVSTAPAETDAAAKDFKPAEGKGVVYLYRLGRAIGAAMLISSYSGRCCSLPVVQRYFQCVALAIISCARLLEYGNRIEPELDCAVALARALALVSEPLQEYRWYHSARADLLRRLERYDEAGAAYRRALDLTTNASETKFLQGRLADVVRNSQADRSV